MGYYLQPHPEYNEEERKDLEEQLKVIEDEGFVERVEELPDNLKERVAEALIHTAKTTEILEGLTNKE